MTTQIIPVEFNKDKLEQLVNRKFGELKIGVETQDKIMNTYLKIVEDNDNSNGNGKNKKDKEEKKFNYVYLHNCRVGLLNSMIGAYDGKDAALAFRAGLLHDVGKTAVRDQTVYNADNFTTKDRAKMRLHVPYTVNMIHSAFPREASIILFHHYFQNESYPTEVMIKELLEEINMDGFSEKKAKNYALDLALADCYDALVTRRNDKFEFIITPENSKEHMLDAYPDHPKLITKLYDKGIFGIDYLTLLGFDNGE
ncbi:MAG: HD domain-containing protein [Nanoarchaeota archaeon]|nr:HD domain-containing protein [Nanoarchaeota archaeon]MBU1321335.1 HD domain-containing protein [Nanoarchaeota archaeon]MBU1597258.1 HD domain-containing protein [Nanoarchaeota archaeon]